MNTNEIKYYDELIDKMLAAIEVINSGKIAEINNMVSGISHELRNPLNVINTAAYLLKKTLHEHKPQEAGYAENMELYLLQIEDSIRRAENIMTNILNITRPSRSKFKILDIASIIEQVLGFVSIDFHYKNINVIKKFSDISPIEGNLNIVRQIFMNIIKNAAQSMPNGGELTIETSWLNLEHESVLIKISDNGIGMNEDCRNNIFKPFFSTKEFGIGLGLYAVKKGIELHRGKIDIVSEEEKGTTFIIELPIRHMI